MIKPSLSLACVLCLMLHEAVGQDTRIVDSLNAVLEVKSGGDRYSPLYELAFEYLDKDNVKALKFIEEAEKAALLSEDSLWIVKSKRVRGQILRELERTVESIPLFESALAISSRQHFEAERMYISNPLGLSYLFHGQFDHALECFAQTVDLSRSEGDTSYMISGLLNTGVVYYKLHDYKNALRYFLECADSSWGKNRPVEFWPYVNITLCYSNLEDFTMAEMYLKKAYLVCGENCSEEGKMHLSFAHAHIFRNSKQFDKALRAFQSSLKLATKTHDTRLMLDNMLEMADILIKKKRLKAAGIYLARADSLTNKGAPYPQAIVELYARFCELYDRLGNYRKLAFYQSKYIHLKDSIYSYELTKRLMATESELKERENKATIAAQQEVLALKEDIISRQRAVNILTVLSGFMVLVFAVYAFLNFRRKRNVNILLEQKIRERTVELELSRDELLKTLREMNLRVQRASGFVNDSINRIEGLCCTGLRETHDKDMHSYFRRISATAGAIGAGIHAFFDGSILGAPA